MTLIAGGTGLATVHDCGFERAHVADLAAAVGVPFAPLTAETRQRLAAVLDPGLDPGNPLDDGVWSVTCLVVRKGYRRRGITYALAAATVRQAW
ncbi:MAG TPA: hypothetical protein VF838_08180 [Trebonia sp.]